MLIHPQFDPVAFSFGPFSVRWYGLTYLFAFVCFALLARLRARRRPETGWNGQSIDDLLFYGVLGVIFGARLGEVLFFRPDYYFAHPLEILMVWHGGMSFHGGFIGVLVAMWLYGRRHGRGFWEITDFIAPMVPVGLFAGRIGNFINAELWGRPMSEPLLPWAMIYRQVDSLPRHPSQLYQAAGEGLLLFALLWWYSSSHRPRRAVSGFFLAGYGILRFGAEFFRTPDPGIFSSLGLGLTTAQWLCVPMFLVGAGLLAHAYSKRHGDTAQTPASGGNSPETS
ncbi:MAG: prolipoprotein diacylglyceryl transferase [Azoarcus sp.]|jgi:phosphatidylglycerol:prolipoprotein diacylglycerol transferase|nr:prolipoprotein diacylglyceryl transferase [Azoarcus sp.]